MIKKSLFALSLVFSVFSDLSFSKNLENYSVFDKNNNISDYYSLLKQAENADIILFGELHNNSIVHWLQLRLTKDLFKNKEAKLVLGGEMFQADEQIIIDEYLNKFISEEQLKSETRLWKNYPTDYKPVIDFALENKLKYIGTNIPIRYANMISKKGISFIDNLDKKVKDAYFPPIPFPIDKNLPNYKKMLSMMSHSNTKTNLGDYMIEAQASKDATMAYFINKNWKPNYIFIHYNGTYHSNNYEGIYWYLKKYEPKLKILTISSVEQDNLDVLENENLNLADFTLCISDDMTKSY